MNIDMSDLKVNFIFCVVWWGVFALCCLLIGTLPSWQFVVWAAVSIGAGALFGLRGLDVWSSAGVTLVVATLFILPTIIGSVDDANAETSACTCEVRECESKEAE